MIGHLTDGGAGGTRRLEHFPEALGHQALQELRHPALQALGHQALQKRWAIRRSGSAATSGATGATASGALRSRSRISGQLHESAPEPADRLLDPLLVLDQGETHEAIASRSEADAGRARYICPLHKELRELQ